MSGLSLRRWLAMAMVVSALIWMATDVLTDLGQVRSYQSPWGKLDPNHPPVLP